MSSAARSGGGGHSSGQRAAQNIYPLLTPATDEDVRATKSEHRVGTQTVAIAGQLALHNPAAKAYECNDMGIKGACFFKSSAASGWAFSNFFRCAVRLRIKDHLRDGVYVFGSTEHAYQWVARVYPKDPSEQTLLKWCGGGDYDRPMPSRDAAKAKAAGPGADKEANCAAGLHAKMLVGKLKTFPVADPPRMQGLSLAQEFELIWRPILTAKYTQTPQLQHALVKTGSNMLVEYSKAFNQTKLGGFVKDAGVSFKRPDVKGELTPAMVDEWRKERWAGNIIKHPTHGTLHCFGFNVMGDFLMRVRAAVGQVPYVPWPNSLAHLTFGTLGGRSTHPPVQGGSRARTASRRRPSHP